MMGLELALLQLDLVWEDSQSNCQKIEHLVQSEYSGEDVLILPEMFSTGFSMNALEFAETMDGQTVSWMKKIASRYQSAVCGSIMIKEEHQFFNRFVWVNPDGSMSTYDKKHLFTLSKEHQTYQAGSDRVIMEYKGWKILPLICYDLRFPEWARNTINYDLLIYVASWPRTRRSHWIKLIQARAIENQCYSIGVNRVGVDGNGLEYTGDSMLVDFKGDVLNHQKEGTGYIKVNINQTHQNEFRSKLPFLQDQSF